MKKIPRNLSGRDLIKYLKKLGYEQSRQVGSHIRLTTEDNGVHRITIPAHDPIKVGTLSNIPPDFDSLKLCNLQPHVIQYIMDNVRNKWVTQLIQSPYNTFLK